MNRAASILAVLTLSACSGEFGPQTTTAPAIHRTSRASAPGHADDERTITPSTGPGRCTSSVGPGCPNEPNVPTL